MTDPFPKTPSPKMTARNVNVSYGAKQALHDKLARTYVVRRA